MTDESRAIARIEAEVKNLSDRWERIEPMLLERSGNIERMHRFEHDLNGLGEKHRASTGRMDTFEERLNENDRRLARWAGMLTALLAVLQAGWALFGDPIRAALLGGPR